MEKEITSWSEFPVSLKTFESAVLIGDISQRDIRRNKSSYQLRNTSVEDEVVLMWINIDDIRIKLLPNNTTTWYGNCCRRGRMQRVAGGRRG